VSHEKLKKFFDALDSKARSSILAQARSLFPPFVWLHVDVDLVELVRNTHNEDDLIAIFHRGLALLDKIDDDAPELDLVSEALDIVWEAIGGDDESDTLD
jgi:hypothetical protein